MIIPICATVIRLLWLAFEWPYLRRHKVRPAKDWDKHSGTIWDVANAIEPVGLLLGFTHIGRINLGNNLLPTVWSQPVACRDCHQVDGHFHTWPILYRHSGN